MAEPIVINAETREITVPESERSLGAVSYTHLTLPTTERV